MTDMSYEQLESGKFFGTGPYPKSTLRTTMMNSLVPDEFDRQDFTWDSNTPPNITFIKYYKSGTLICTLALSYDGSTPANLTRVERQ